MSVSDTAGRTYDTQEYSRLDAFLKEQQGEMDKIDKEKSVQTIKIVQYVMVLTGVALTLFIFNKFVNKKR
jgi:hypothetical protein